MLFLLFGSSAAGKTAALDRLRDRLPRLAIHDFDELGVPSDADTAWRQRANEVWVQRALEYQAEGVDLLLAGQTPFGELLATPSAPLLEGVAACLLDCDDDTRLARLHARPRRRGGSPEALLNWAEWMRRHARDPQWVPEVISGDSAWPEMRWERWRNWRAGDPRWRVRLIDTSHRPGEQVANELSAWIEDERALVPPG